MVEGKDNIKDLFSEKLAGFEANVRPELWANISSQIGVTSGAAASGGLSILTKAIIGITAAASIVGLSVILFHSSEKEEKQKENIIITEQEIITPKETEKEISETPQAEKIEEPNKIEEKNISDRTKQILAPILGGNEEKTETTAPVLNKDLVKEEKIVQPTPVKVVTPEVVNPAVTEAIEKEQEIVVVKESEVLMDLPNIFTPNGDRVNDFLSVDAKGLTDFNVVVHDNKNKIVYKSNEPSFVWDGVGMNGDLVPAGDYVYYITARDSKGNLVTRHSTLRIQR